MKEFFVAVIAAGLACVNSCQEATGAAFFPLGYLPGGDFSSSAADVSADGATVVGRSHSARAGLEAFVWRQSTGMIGLGDFPEGDAVSGATAVSGDGQVVVGNGTAVYFALVDGFVWTESGGLEQVGYLQQEGTLYSYPGAVSNDGMTVGGSSDNRAFIWTRAEGIREIPGVSDVGGHSGVGGISADGKVIAGSREVNGIRQPYRYATGIGVQDLGIPPGSVVDNIVSGISSDGSVIIGNASRQGWRWNEIAGFEPLPLLPESNSGVYPTDLTADGSIIIGTTTQSTDPAARFPSFIWTKERGTENLETFLFEQYGLNMPGWSLTRATGISDDGTVIVGGGVNPSGRPEAWVIDLRIPEPRAIALCICIVLSSSLRIR